MHARTTVSWILGLLVAAGCGGGGGDGAPPPPPSGGGGSAPSGGGAAKAWSADQGTATVSGRVGFGGTAPKRRSIDMSREKTCDAHHGTSALDESVIVGADNGLKNVFVWVRKGMKGWTFSPPSAPVVLGQKNCVYVPHVVGLQVGQKLRVSNGDDFMHNVHGYPKRNEAFNFSQGGGAHKDLTFPRSDVPLPFKCDVHGWMGAYVGVVEHPFFAVTGDDGTFTLPKLPPGSYTISAWHEVYGRKDQSVTVSGSESKTLAFSFSADDE